MLLALKTLHSGFQVTGCWINLNGPGVGHRQHSHPNNFLVGVYNVRTPPGADTLNHHDPRVQRGIIRPVRALTAQNTDRVVVRVLIFLSWLPHSVSAGTADSDRVNVSFKLMFTSYAETLSAPLW